MKNKKALYYLLPVNILVWGFAIYRIVSYGNETNSAAHTVTGKFGSVCNATWTLFAVKLP